MREGGERERREAARHSIHGIQTRNLSTFRSQPFICAPPFLLSSLLQHNDGNYVISLSQLVRWLGEQAEELGVDIFPGFSAAEVLYDETTGGVVGVATRDVGIGKDGEKKSNYQPGMELRAKQTLFAEGARGSCSESVMAKFGLREGGKEGEGKKVDEQTYGLGIKEVWEVPEGQHKPGYVRKEGGREGGSGVAWDP